MPTARAVNRVWEQAWGAPSDGENGPHGSFTAVGLMQAAGLTPDPWQIGVTQAPGDQLLLCHRQSGKSTIAASLATEKAIQKDEALILLVAPSLRQSGELMRKVKSFYHRVKPMPLIQESALSMEIENGSRIVSLPGTPETIVGYSAVDLLLLDEASRIPDPVYYSLRPMMAVSGGHIVALSTPYGRRGWFFEACEGAADVEQQQMDKQLVAETLADLGWKLEDVPDEPDRVYGWTRTRLSAVENKRLSPYFLANERRTVPDMWFRQEYLVEFLDTMDAVFRHEDIMNLLDETVLPLFPAGANRDALETILTAKVPALF